MQHTIHNAGDLQERSQSQVRARYLCAARGTAFGPSMRLSIRPVWPARPRRFAEWRSLAVVAKSGCTHGRSVGQGAQVGLEEAVGD